MEAEKKYVCYEDFGAVGDGEHDDLDAIIAAHDYANAHHLPVKTKFDAHYYIGPAAKSAYIETDVDWNTSRFTIDDRAVEDNTVPCFYVRSTLKTEDIAIHSLAQDAKKLDVQLTHDHIVTVYNDHVAHFIRLGLNRDAGEAAQDTFVLKKDGTIYGMLDWDMDPITRVEAFPIDEEPLNLHGGVFTTIANREVSTYNYYARSVEIHRSRVTVDNVTHYVAGELSHGAPYRGFISAMHCAYLTVRNCFFTGHKIYWTIGRAELPVPMGSYDLHAHNVVDLHCTDCRVNGITDNTRWGVIETDFCKNIVLERCIFSRLDAHMGVSGEYTIRDCQLGHQGLNAIGHGVMTVENTTLYGDYLINFRGDYGSNWRGDVVVKNCRWIPSCGRLRKPEMFAITNAGMHNFGYPCSMPENFLIENLRVEDCNVPEDYEGMDLFSDPDVAVAGADFVVSDPRPFPYAPCKTVTITGLDCASGKPVHIGPAKNLLKDAHITVNGKAL